MARPKRRTLEERFPDRAADVGYNSDFVWSHIDQSAGAQACWRYTGAHHRQGYGMVGGYRLKTRKMIMQTVHRLLWKIQTGQDPGQRDIVHTCGNMWCVNPDHLTLGDAKLISEFRRQRGRQGGNPGGYRRTTPRKQTYRWGLDNIIAVYRGEMTDIDFAKANNLTMQKARKIIGDIRRGEIYPWLKEYTR